MLRKPILLSICPLMLVAGAIYLWKVVGVTLSASDTEDAKPEEHVVPERVPTGLSPEQLATANPVDFLAECLVKYREAGIKGYTCTFSMHERINGKLRPPEQVECWFKEEPFSVMMHWKEGASLAAASLYVFGENGNKMCVRPEGKLQKAAVSLNGGYVTRPVDGSEAKESARYLITEFGLRCGTERTYKAWKALRDRGATLQVKYLGIQNMKEAGGRPCHVLRRTCNPPEEEGLTQITIYVDVESWFQVGSVLKQNDELIGEYWFTDIKLNPGFDEKQFKPETLKKF